MVERFNSSKVETDLTSQEVIQESAKDLSNLQKEIERLPGKLTIEVKKGDTLGKIVRRDIFKYYPNLSEEDKKGWKLAKQTIEEVKRQNKIVDEDSIKPNDKLSVNMNEITSIIDGYLFNINGGGEIPESIDVSVKQGDILSKIIEENIYKYYPNLSKEGKKDRKLKKQISDKIVEQNKSKIANENSLKPDIVLEIDMLEITPIINNYLDNQENLDDIKEIPESFTYTFKKGDNLSKVIRENVYNYFPELNEILDKKKLDKLTKEIARRTMELNSIKDEKNIQIGEAVTFNMTEIIVIVNRFKSESSDEVPSTLTYTIKQGDTLGEIVRREIYKYYPNLALEDQSWKLTNEISQEIMKQNHITDPKNITTGKDLTIKMENITKIIQHNLNEESSGGNDEKIETIGKNEYISLSSIKEFEKLRKSNGLVERLYYSNRDDGPNKSAKTMIDTALRNGKKVLIPSYIENKNSKILKLEDIIKPEKLIDNKLKGKKFVLDPGHGFNDSGAIGLIDTGNKTETVTFEGAISMDVAYRAAKLLKSHGAAVEFTHYTPTRGISNLNDLPPCLQYGKGENIRNQDKRRGQTEDTTGFVDHKTSIRTRSRITNEINKNGNVDMLISLHMNSAGGKNVEIGNKDSRKVESGKFAEHLSGNGFGEKKSVGLGVMNGTACPSVLIEMGNIKSKNDSEWFRSGEGRQKKAEELVNTMLKYYK